MQIGILCVQRYICHMCILREFGNCEVVVTVIGSSSFSYHVDTRSEEREQYNITCLYLKSLSAFFNIQV